jgi:hypothetical protein
MAMELNLACLKRVEVKFRPMVNRPVYLGVGLPSGTHDQSFFFSCIDNYEFVDVGRPL